MNGVKWGGLSRALLSAFGGWLVSKGIVSEEGAQQVIASVTDVLAGLLTIAATVAWSWWSKRKNKETVNEKSETSEKGQAGKTGEARETGA